MARSLAAGVKNLPAEIEGVLIMLCDQWQLAILQICRNWFRPGILIYHKLPQHIGMTGVSR